MRKVAQFSRRNSKVTILDGPSGWPFMLKLHRARVTNHPIFHVQKHDLPGSVIGNVDLRAEWHHHVYDMRVCLPCWDIGLHPVSREFYYGHVMSMYVVTAQIVKMRRVK